MSYALCMWMIASYSILPTILHDGLYHGVFGHRIPTLSSSVYLNLFRFVVVVVFEILFKSEITGIKVNQIFGKAADDCTLCVLLEYFFMSGIQQTYPIFVSHLLDLQQFNKI